MINILSKYKFVFYFINLTLIFLYLFPGSLPGCILYDDCTAQPQLTPDFMISSNHFYAFVILSIAGFLTYKKSENLYFLKIYLILLSILLELLHFFIPNRSFEISDLFGNLVGVVFIIIVNYILNREKFKN